MSIQIKTSRSGHRQFWLDGKRLPSPSTICSRYKDSGGLVHWANRVGLEGKTLDEARDESTTPGSIVHSRIEALIRGQQWDRSAWDARIAAARLEPDPIWERVENAWKAFSNWRELMKLDVIAAEVSLASEEHRYGGTLDAVAVGNQTLLLDWKTGNLYPDHVLQMGGYMVLWEANMDQALDGAGLLSINKEHGGFAFSTWPRPALQIACDQFLALRECYERDKALKKLL